MEGRQWVLSGSESSCVESIHLIGEANKHCTQAQVSETAGIAHISERLVRPEVNAEGRASREKGSISGPNKEKIISADTEAIRSKTFKEN